MNEDAHESKEIFNSTEHCIYTQTAKFWNIKAGSYTTEYKQRYIREFGKICLLLGKTGYGPQGYPNQKL